MLRQIISSGQRERTFRVLVGPLTTQQELGTCCYLLHRVLAPWCSMVKALKDLIDAINVKPPFFSGKMVTSHRCTVLGYNVGIYCPLIPY